MTDAPEEFFKWALECKLVPGFRYYRLKLYDSFMREHAWIFRMLSKQRFNSWLYDYAFIKFKGEPFLGRDSQGSYIEYVNHKVGVFDSYVNRIHFVNAVKFDGTRELAKEIREFMPEEYTIQMEFNTLVILDNKNVEVFRVFPGQYIVVRDRKYSIWEEEDFNNKYTLNNDRK